MSGVKRNSKTLHDTVPGRVRYSPSMLHQLIHLLVLHVAYFYKLQISRKVLSKQMCCPWTRATIFWPHITTSQAPKQLFDPFCLPATADFNANSLLTYHINSHTAYRGVWSLTLLVDNASVTSSIFQEVPFGVFLCVYSPLVHTSMQVAQRTGVLNPTRVKKQGDHRSGEALECTAHEKVED